jgi:3-isopropylmalate/(R)-2-methylmalate dehydratase large subunit
MTKRTLYDKIWDDHVVAQREGEPALLYVDLQLAHEVTSPQAFDGLRARGLKVRRPERHITTIDHSIPTTDRSLPIADPIAAKQIEQMRVNCAEFGVPLMGPGTGHNGVVHVFSPELGLIQPGMTLVCGDSHTATHGAFGVLAFGIGTSQVEMVMATQCLLQHPSKNLRVNITGKLKEGVTAKDIILALIAKIGVGGGTGCVIEYSGEAIRGLSMEGRMTISNMSIEAGARAGLIAPDEVTFEYLKGRQFAPKGADWDAAVARWKTYVSDEGAVFDKEVTLDGSALEPMITYGTTPAMGIPISGKVPDPATLSAGVERDSLVKALAYMGMEAGQPILGHPVDVVFVGSCTNGRIEDLRAAAGVLKGRKVNPRTKTLIVPGSEVVKKVAEAEGLDKIFLAAGAEWREPGCSMCLAMNGDMLQPGEVCVGTSNRNFEGRMGPGGRTLLASPVTAAACAIEGAVADPRKFGV